MTQPDNTTKCAIEIAMMTHHVAHGHEGLWIAHCVVCCVLCCVDVCCVVCVVCCVTNKQITDLVQPQPQVLGGRSSCQLVLQSVNRGASQPTCHVLSANVAHHAELLLYNPKANNNTRQNKVCQKNQPPMPLHMSLVLVGHTHTPHHSTKTATCSLPSHNTQQPWASSATSAQ